MSNLMDRFNDKFKINELKLYETEYWIWSLRPNQVTLGSGILSLKRECSEFGDLTAEEYGDLKNIIKVIERTLKSLFRYNVMNYLMLMMVDKQVHYHVIPRYESDAEIFGFKWKDEYWPGVPKLDGESLDIIKLTEITTYIKNNIK